MPCLFRFAEVFDFIVAAFLFHAAAVLGSCLLECFPVLFPRVGSANHGGAGNSSPAFCFRLVLVIHTFLVMVWSEVIPLVGMLHGLIWADADFEVTDVAEGFIFERVGIGWGVFELAGLEQFDGEDDLRFEGIEEFDGG